MSDRSAHGCHTQGLSSLVMLLVSQVFLKVDRLLKVKRLKIFVFVVRLKADNGFGHGINCGFILPLSLFQKGQVFTLNTLVVGVVFFSW